MIVLDTNVVSELMSPSPSVAVVRWMSSTSKGERRTTSITLAEIGYGIERLPDGRRKERFREAAYDVFEAFEDRVLPFEVRAARRYATIVCDRDRLGAPIDGFDAQIAAICLVHDATLATRNVKDFTDTGVRVVDPWTH